MSDLDCENWWASLYHGGVLIAPARLSEHFGGDIQSLGRSMGERLRREVVRMLNDEKHMGAFLDFVFEELLGLDGSSWLKANQVGAAYAQESITGEIVRPRRVWRGANGETLPLFAITGERGKKSPRIGIGVGRRDVSRVIEWLRNTNQKMAAITNGRQIRLVHAGPDYDAFCEWDIELWFEEGEPGPQVTALRRLLGRQALVASNEGIDSPILRAITDS